MTKSSFTYGVGFQGQHISVSVDAGKGLVLPLELGGQTHGTEPNVKNNQRYYRNFKPGSVQYQRSFFLDCVQYQRGLEPLT